MFWKRAHTKKCLVNTEIKTQKSRHTKSIKVTDCLMLSRAEASLIKRVLRSKILIGFFSPNVIFIPSPSYYIFVFYYGFLIFCDL